MRVLILFDSVFGNTERIAWAMGAALAPQATVAVKRIDDVPVADPATFDLLIVGGPTQRHGASPALAAWLEGLGRRTLRGVPAAAFDTRYRMSPFLSGAAARVIAGRLRRAGCRLVTTPESFLIERHRPPSGEARRHDVERLEAGEVERAGAWAVGLLPCHPLYAHGHPHRRSGSPRRRWADADAVPLSRFVGEAQVFAIAVGVRYGDAVVQRISGCDRARRVQSGRPLAKGTALFAVPVAPTAAGASLDTLRRQIRPEQRTASGGLGNPRLRLR
jgi:flavodoxin